MRKICIFTAEYGLLRWVMQGTQDALDLTLQIVIFNIIKYLLLL